MIRPNTFASITGTTERDELEAAIHEFEPGHVAFGIAHLRRKHGLSMLTDDALTELYDTLRAEAMAEERFNADSRAYHTELLRAACLGLPVGEPR